MVAAHQHRRRAYGSRQGSRCDRAVAAYRLPPTAYRLLIGGARQRDVPALVRLPTTVITTETLDQLAAAQGVGSIQPNPALSLPAPAARPKTVAPPSCL